jgi:hypothetical protein
VGAGAAKAARRVSIPHAAERMAHDPYGFPESAPTAGDPSDASRAMWYALGSGLLGSVGICFCYLPYLIALPMSVYAVFLGNRALRTATTDDGRAMANGGLTAGIVSACVSGIFALFFLFYALFMALYFIVIVVALAASGGQ